MTFQVQTYMNTVIEHRYQIGADGKLHGARGTGTHNIVLPRLE
jgi:hypothetical protein